MSQSYYPDDFGLNVARGVVKGTSHLHKFGAIPSLSNNTTATIWDGANVYPWSAFDTANTASVSSDNSNDNTKVVTVQGLDDNYEFVEEQITIPSTGSVSFKRINRAFISSGTTNEGEISIDVNSTTVAAILDDLGQTLMSVYTVPANTTLYMTKLVVSADASATIFMYKKFPTEEAFRIAHTGELFSGLYEYHFDFPLAVPATTDIDLQATSKSGGGNARITASFDALLIEDGLGS